MTEKEQSSNFYAVVPGSVRYDAHLGAGPKVLYAEISALVNYHGVCTHSNQYFVDALGMDKGYVAEWLVQLEGRGHIEIRKTQERREIRTPMT